MGTTLKFNGITWNAGRHNGKLSLTFGVHVIQYETSTGLYHLKEDGETIFADKALVLCMEHASEVAHEIVCENVAREIIPSWEASS